MDFLSADAPVFERTAEHLATATAQAAEGQLAILPEFIPPAAEAGGARVADTPGELRAGSNAGDTRDRNLSRREADRANRTDMRTQMLCRAVREGRECTNERCTFMHDPKAYAEVRKEIDLPCPTYAARGACPVGVNCVCSGHVERGPDGSLVSTAADERMDTGVHGVIPREALRRVRQEFGGRRGSSRSAEARAARDGDRPKRGFLKDKLVLAPMCTVGTLPFRRLCVAAGCDATVSEMAVAQPLLRGDAAEWARLRRHESERCFGIQLTGRGAALEGAARAVVETLGEDHCQFIDLNAACPQAFVTNKGLGSALNRTPEVAVSHATTLASALAGTGIAATIKLRTGVRAADETRHGIEVCKLFGEKVAAGAHEDCEDAGARALAAQFEGVFMHGRTAPQRYARLADINYLGKAAQALHENASECTFTGNGDVFNPADASELRALGADSIMIGRGALVKPWIFTELKRGCVLDPSSSDRLAMLREFAGYLLDHHGSDARGVEQARLVLLEHLSFLCRYTPPGVSCAPEALKLNQRPDSWVGRDELETLMGSPRASDWVKITEMVLGPVPAGFEFTAKHKSAAY